MKVEELEKIADDVEKEFLQKIMELNNNEVEQVCRILVEKFEGHLTRLEAGAR